MVVLGDLVWAKYAVTFVGAFGKAASKVTAGKMAKMVSGKQNSCKK